MLAFGEQHPPPQTPTRTRRPGPAWPLSPLGQPRPRTHCRKKGRGSPVSRCRNGRRLADHPASPQKKRISVVRPTQMLGEKGR